MSATVPCIPACCNTQQVVNVPGGQGLSGDNGTSGISAFTSVSSQFTVPACSSTVTISVASSQWMAIGQTLIVSDGTHWMTGQVTAIPTTTSVTLSNLCYQADNNTPGVTIIGAAAIVSPVGARFTIPAPQTVYGSGTVYELSNTAARLNMGTNPPTLTLATAGTYLIYASANVKYLSATFAANGTMEIHLRRTNNTPADITPTLTVATPIVTTKTDEYGQLILPVIAYTATAGDVIELWGSGSVNPFPDNFSAGVHAMQVTQTSLIAVRIS